MSIPRRTLVGIVLVALVLIGLGGAGGYWLAQRGGSARSLTVRLWGPQRARIESLSTGTTRWCRTSTSKNRASRPSWTCSWCRNMPMKAGEAGGGSGKSQHGAEPRNSSRPC